MLINQVLLAWSIVNVFVASIRTISRVQVIFRTSAIDAVEGPSLETTNSTLAFAQCVEMALDASSQLDFDEDTFDDQNLVSIVNSTDQESGMTIAAFQPGLFRRLRSLFGISEQDYVRSIFHSGSFVSFQSNSKGAARVGGTFFFTRDGSYMVKTIKPEEIDAVQSMLSRYYEFMKENGKRSLLTRICGLYSVEVDGKRQVYIVMNAVFPPAASALLTERFDIKGSTVGRRCCVNELESKGKDAVLKDCDLLDEIALLKSRSGHKLGSRKHMIHSIQLGEQKKSALMTQLHRDVKLLAECNLIDYSLLVGIVDLESDNILDDDSVDAIRRAQAVSFEMRLFEARLARRIYLRTRSLALSVLTTPVRVARRTAYWARHVIVPHNFPYYGVERCNIDGGALSVLRGKRKGKSSIYYLGLIDFLQPFTTFKQIEWRTKRLRYGEGCSCVPPDEYAKRFLSFIEENFH